LPSASGDSHCPFVVAPAAVEHAAQLPVHAALQQTLSAQKVLAHSCPPAQVAPGTFFSTQSPELSQ
jgi:hypothetical protein